MAAMADPIGGHPTREEQLDILTACLAETVPAPAAVLDVGCGTGFLADMILGRRPELDYVGLDLKAESLDMAREVASAHGGGERQFIEADLARVDEIDLAGRTFGAALSVLVFHDLDDAAKRACISWIAEALRPGGVFYLYDRVRLTDAETFPQQQAIWRRIERIHGRPMSSAESFAAYEADLQSTNRPARLADYLTWLPDVGLTTQILHLHGNVALIAGVKGAG